MSQNGALCSTHSLIISNYGRLQMIRISYLALIIVTVAVGTRFGEDVAYYGRI